jgi:hypothetical protein
MGEAFQVTLFGSESFVKGESMNKVEDLFGGESSTSVVS